MKKAVILSSLSNLLLISAFGQFWVSFPTIQSTPNINGFSVFSVDGKGYLMGGSNGAFSNTSQYNDSVYVYDPLTDLWATLGEFPGTNTVYGNSTSYGNKAYYGFGYNGNQTSTASNNLWEFDPFINAWTQLTSCPCEGRAEIAMVALNDTIYIGFGDNFTATQYSDWWAYDIVNDNWIQKANFPGQSRHHPQYFALNDEIYVGLGHDDNLGDLESFYKYIPSTDNWVQLNDFPVSIEGPGGQFTYQGEGYIAFGLNNMSNNNTNNGQFWKYDVSSDTWAQMPSYEGNGYLSPLTFIIDSIVYMVTESNYWNGAGSTDYNKFDLETISSITEAYLKKDIVIYPNPNNGNFTIEIPDLDYVEILDMEGRKVKTVNSKNVGIEGLGKGIYLLRIIVGNESYNDKIIIR